MILWLEDQKIRQYKIETREGLRQMQSNDWQKAFDTYIKDVGCPIPSNKPIEQFEWLLSFAVRLEFADNGILLSIQSCFYYFNACYFF